MTRIKRRLALMAMVLLLLGVATFPIGARNANADGGIDTRIYGELDKSDTIDLPITIYDYHNDGMLFDFASADAPSATYRYDGKTYNMGNNYGYGFLGASETIAQNPNHYQLPSIADYWEDDSIVVQNGVTVGLVEDSLDANGKPIYCQNTVEYLAQLIQMTLQIPQRARKGNYNYNFVEGTADGELFGYSEDGTERDFAQYLRETLTDYDLGSYQASSQKQLTSLSEIATCTDAAMFMLKNLYSTGYSKPISEYNTLKLTSETDENGNKKYVFDSAYEGVIYDTAGGEIYLDAQTAQADYMLLWGTTYIPANFFLPITPDIFDKYCGQTVSPYLLDEGVSSYNGNSIEYPIGSGKYNDTYDGRDYNYTMEGHAQFVYDESDDLFFRFTGDDALYIYINGVLALDIGGAHSIAQQQMQLNELADRCGLVDGEAFTFDLFYTEQHGYGANLRIETNIELYDPNVFSPQTGAQAHIVRESSDGAGLYTNGIRFKTELNVRAMQDALDVGDLFACGTLIIPLNRLNTTEEAPYQADIMTLEIDTQTGEFSSPNSAPVVVLPNAAVTRTLTPDTMIEWTTQMEAATDAAELLELLRSAGMTVFGVNEDNTAVRYVVYLKFEDNGTLVDSQRRAQADREIAFRGFFVRLDDEGYSVCNTLQRANSATRIFNHFNYENYGILNDGITPEQALNGRSILAPSEQLSYLDMEVVA